MDDRVPRNSIGGTLVQTVRHIFNKYCSEFTKHAISSEKFIFLGRGIFEDIYKRIAHTGNASMRNLVNYLSKYESKKYTNFNLTKIGWTNYTGGGHEVNDIIIVNIYY